ncbi:protein kinase subdomain-containing protein [Penicillium lividum]|nr:protein kinase subdomain-containing protein [Penicillium lividum]
MQKEATIRYGEPNPVDTTGLCLLSLDGGGVRGLSSLYILKSIMDRLNHARQQAGLYSVKPCEVFDLIGGTSTGGLIAIMLGRLEMDVDRCIAAYSDLAAAVFGEKMHSIPINFKGDITAKFDSAKLERAIQKVVEDSGASEQDLFNDDTGSRDGTARGCRTFVCTADRYTKDTVRLRSYSLPHEPNIRVTICQAALATSAATTFFDPVSIGNRSFADGGLGANNPVDEVEGEASNIWCSETGDLKPLVKCFISIGTGNPGKKPFENSIIKFLGKTVVQIATETENTERRFIARWAKHFDENRYFRFNVEQGLQEIGLDEYKKKGPMEAATEGYLTHMAQKFRVRDCVQNMRLKENKTEACFARIINEYITRIIRQQPADRFHIPFRLTAMPEIKKESFLGRQDNLKDLWQYFQPTQTQSRKVAILHGLGGIGKTQLAIRFARDHQQEFSAIFWLSGKDQGTLVQSFSSYFSRLPEQPEIPDDVQRRFQKVREWLEIEGNSRWLIILDNVDKYTSADSATGDSYDVRKFFPETDHGSILITSRLTELAELGQLFPVRKLEQSDAIELLLSESGLLSSTDKHLKASADTLSLATRLDGLPLAIVIAAAYMRNTSTSITDYLDLYQKSWRELQSRSSPARQYKQGNMLKTWMISFREVQKRDPNAAALLLLLARFDNRGIWYELIRNASNSYDVPDWLNKAISSKVEFNYHVQPLIAFSLLDKKQQQGSYAMHPVVQDWCIHSASILDTLVDPVQLSELALICVGYSVPSSSERGYTDLQRRLLPHTIRLQTSQLSVENVASLGGLSGLGSLYKDQGKLKEAEEIYQRALAGFEKVLGPGHISTLNTVNNLGNLYYDQGKPKEAEEMYQRALAGYEKTLGPDHTSTLNTVNNLGLLYYAQGKLKKAEDMYQRALVGYEKAYGPDHTSTTLNTVNNLGLLYKIQGKLKEAEEIYQRVLVGYEKAYGPDHTSTLNTVNNLGNLYYDQGKLKEAEEMYQRALVGYEKAYGPNHMSTLRTVGNIGLIYKDQGKLKEAEQIYQRTLVGFEKALGPDHTSTLNTVNNLGLLYYDQGKLKEAEEMYQRALAGYDKALGPDHISTLDSIHYLGILYYDQGKLKDAEEIYQRVLVGYEKVLGPDHTFTLWAVGNLGLLYKHQGKLKEAEQVYQRALVGYEKTLGPDHASTLNTFNNLGNVYYMYGRGKLKEAEEMYQRALVGYEKTLGPDHTSTLNTVNNLRLLYNQSKLKQAEEIYQGELPNNQKVAHLNASMARRTIEKFARLFK